MEILNYISLIYQKINIYILVSTRIAGLLGTFIMFRRDFVNLKVIVSLISILSLFVMIFIPTALKANGDFSSDMFFNCGFQFLIGFSAGLILNFVFEIFNAAGQIISTQVGLSIDSLFDPRLGSITGLTRFYFLSLLLAFMLLNGHLLLLKILIESFQALPITTYFLPKKLLKEVIHYSSVIFTGSVGISLRVIISMMLVNIALSVMSRFAPQFNVMTIGTSLTLVSGIIYVYLTFNIFIDKGSLFLTQGIDVVEKYLVKVPSHG